MTTITRACGNRRGRRGLEIASHLTNAGVNVVLLDLDAETAAAAVTRQLKAGGASWTCLSLRVSGLVSLWTI